MKEEQSELARLETIAKVGGYTEEILDEKIHGRIFEIFSGHMREGATLEVGPAEGLMTGRISEMSQTLTLLEPTPSMADSLEKRFPKANVVRNLMEEWSPESSFQNIFLMHVLEHVADGAQCLQRATGWLEDGGLMFVSVPNAMSVHRQAGVEMGIIETVHSPSERDLKIGHRRVYTSQTLKKEIEAAGLSIVKQGGVFLKAASNAQILKWGWNGDLIDAFVAIGEKHPEIASDIYIVAKKITP